MLPLMHIEKRLLATTPAMSLEGGGDEVDTDDDEQEDEEEKNLSSEGKIRRIDDEREKLLLFPGLLFMPVRVTADMHPRKEEILLRH